MKSSTAVAKKDTVRDLVEQMGPAFQRGLPKHIRGNVDRYMRVALTTLKENDKLMQCSQPSLLASMMNAAQLGLDPGGIMGHAYLIPYGRECKLIVGYKGLVELAYRSGKVRTIEARVVSSKDIFGLELGTQPHIKHIPTLTDSGEFSGVYAVAHMKDGGVHFEHMTKKQVDAIKNRSRAKNDGPWKTDYEEMAKKTVVRRLVKLLPLSVEVSKAVVLDEQAEAGLPQSVVDLPDADFTVVPPEPKAATPPAAKAPEESGGAHSDAPPAPPVAMVQCQGADCKLPSGTIRQTAAVNVGTQDKPILMCPNCARDFKPKKRGRPKKNSVEDDDSFDFGGE